MVKRATTKACKNRRGATGRKRAQRSRTGLRSWIWRICLAASGVVLGAVALFAVIPPPTTPYILAEGLRHGGVERRWVPLEEIAPVMARSAVAAEDANFCLHWGFDMAAIREALDDGANRGASTLSQQTVKNVYLWQGRSWPRKALEAVLTAVVELIWSKRRIVEVYLNVAEFDRGVFGVEAAARHYFCVGAGDLTAAQAARLAAILPDPKGRSAAEPSDFVRRRAGQIADGAATIAADGRASCFQ